MCKHITLFPSLKDDENDKVISGIRALESRGVSVTIVGDSGILDGFVELPSIHTDEGVRASGVEDINEYLGWCMTEMR